MAQQIVIIGLGQFGMSLARTFSEKGAEVLAIDSSNPLRITVLNQVPKALELLRQDPQVSRLSVDENKIAAWFSGSREEEAYLLQKLVDAGILVVSFAREHNSLESLFFHLTGETEQKSRNTETFGNTIG